MIAEDNEDDAYFLKYALKQAGLPSPIHICADGEEVRNYLKGEGIYADRYKYRFPRIVVLDLKMPKMGGLDVLRWLKKDPKCGVIPVIILSSSEHPADIDACYQAGANAYLVKDPGLDRLKDILRRLHEFWSCCKLPVTPYKC